VNHPIPVTLSDYLSALAASASESHPGRGRDAAIPGGCERCHTAITSHTAHFARFGTLRCADCIGDDGFATVADLELFRRTGTLPCSGCGQLAQPSQVSPDGLSATYQCRACGTSAHFTITPQATAIYGPGITGRRP
jgi:hypothetical protein